MSLLRTFIAIEIPPDIQDAISEQTATLRRVLARPLVRWVPVRNIHLTLKFLGDVSPANIELLCQMLLTETAQHPPFDIEIGNLGVFPDRKRPRVLWIGVQAPEALHALQRGIEAAAALLGYEPERRPFSPHLTIGRVNQRLTGEERQRVREALGNTHVGSLGRAVVEAVHLFRSDLKPGGAVYTPLFSAALGKTQASSPTE